MGIFILLLLLAYLITGLLRNILLIWEWAERKDEREDKKEKYKKKLEE